MLKPKEARTTPSSSAETLRLSLPFPPSLNNLFVNVPGRGRVKSARYTDWCERATARLYGQRMAYIKGPVVCYFWFEDHSRCDLDNLNKPILDFLVHHQFIEDDCCSIVRGIHSEWADIKDVQIEIVPIVSHCNLKSVTS